MVPVTPRDRVREGALIAALALGLGLTACSVPPGAPGPSPSTGAHTDAARTPVPEPSAVPPRPRIPETFSWSGRYAVPDLGIEVPFVWYGNDGDFQMIAGGDGDPVHFTNIIRSGELYTLTYAWPEVPRMPCSHVGSFTLAELNAGFATASFAGEETLHREDDHLVHHFRSVGTVDLPSDLLGDTGVPLRVPLMAGDIYVDADDPSSIRQLLHFGVQNLYDPNLDEWILVDETSADPREVELPEECVAA